MLALAFAALLLPEGEGPVGSRVLWGAGATAAIGALAWRIRRKERARSENPADPVYSYRGGPNPDADPWTTLDLRKIDGAVEWFSTKEGIRGQDEALRVLRDELYLARAGLSGIATGIETKPKVALFFAGPTGVGKTLTALKLAKFLFGNEEQFLRLDMTEFKEEHTVHKLVGAPPSYVGFDRGGVLTNAVERQPYLVVLVDEVEKAHPKVLDIFLQILDHGRLMSGRGQPVSFRETAILFTSNLGTRTQDGQGRPVGERADLERLLQEPEDPANPRRDRIRVHFRRAVERFFTHEISRPELMNRIGHAIVPFNFIDDPEIQMDVVRSILGRLKEHVERTWAEAGYRIEIDEDIPEFLVSKESASFTEFGARWIAHALRQELLRRLAPVLLAARGEGRAHRLFRVHRTPDGKGLAIEESER
jgi:ATP-dependent Clp protease ATP-binding subunit ClpA